MTSTAAERELAVLHLWDAGIVRPESLGEQVIDSLLGEGWRPPAGVVSTVAELDALPVGTVVRAADSDVCEKMPVKFSDQTTDVRWRSPSWEGVLSEADIALPATVLWVGGTE